MNQKEKPNKTIFISTAPDMGHIDSMILSLALHMRDAEKKGAGKNVRKEATEDA